MRLVRIGKFAFAAGFLATVLTLLYLDELVVASVIVLAVAATVQILKKRKH